MAPLSVPFYHEAGATSSLLQYAKLLGSAWRSPSSERLTLPAPRPSAFPRWRVRANLKERDENVRFKQSMTSHVSREGQGNWRQMEMQADLILWLALFVGLGAVAIFL
jgi:hypothetical protein